VIYINLTPHDIVLKKKESENVIHSTKKVRCTTFTQKLRMERDEYVPREIVWDVMQYDDLPPPREGCIYIVSSRVERLHPDRMDVWYPGQFERDPITQRPLACSVLRKYKNEDVR
jgi:hypothetical protein